MKLLKEKIIENKNNIDLSTYFMEQIDIDLLNEIGKEVKSHFKGVKVDKIIISKIQSISIATIISQHFNNANVIFANNEKEEIDFSILNKHINENDNILFFDYFLSETLLVKQMINFLNEKKANLIGVTSVLERTFKNTRFELENLGIRVESLLRIKKLEDNIEFIEKKKKYIIFTLSTGGGHNKAADALKKEIENNGDSAIIVNLFQKESKSPIIKDVVEKGYDVLVNLFPGVYDIVYKMIDKKISRDLLENLLIFTRKNILNIIEKENPDIIISTHPFGAVTIGKILEKEKIDLPFIQIVTDYQPHYTYISKSIKAYVVASEYTKELLAKRGVPKEIIYALGIPISDEFKVINKVESNKFTVLIMGGAVAKKEIKKYVRKLVYDKLDIEIDVICGKNEKLYEELEEEFSENTNVKIIGFTNDVSYYMDKAKLIITKPGGLTTTESISKNLPMIIPFYIPGQEKQNLDFLVENNMAIEINEENDLSSTIQMLMLDESRYNEMVSNMKELSEKFSVKKIIEMSNSLID